MNEQRLAPGWDAADALVDGWTAERVAALTKRPGFFLKTPAPPAKAKAQPQAELPRGFEIEDSGLYFRDTDDDGKMRRYWICSPLRVIAETRDESGNNWGRLIEFQNNDGQVQRWAMPMEMLRADGADYRGTLLSMGLLIGPGQVSKAKLTVYLQIAKPAKRARCVERTGWFGSVYVLPDRTIGASDEMVLFQSAAGSSSTVREKGTLAEWRAQVAAPCQGNSRLLFAASCGFAAILLEKVGAESGGFHFRCDSSTGKTTALRVAASIFGGPEYLQRWRATDNGLEALAMRYSGQLLPLDELAQVDPRIAGEAAYMLANGAGKSRASKTGALRESSSWNLLFLSSGEIGLAQHMQEAGKKTRAGQEVRLLDIPGDTGAGFGLFETLHGYASGSLFADALTKAVRQYHGTAAIAFVEQLAQCLDALPGMYKAAAAQFSLDHLPDNASGQAQRAAGRFALVGAAGEIATQFGITGWSKGDAMHAAQRCFRAWLDARGGAGNQEERDILAQVREFFQRHEEARFTEWDRVNDDHAPRTMNRAGFRRMRAETGEIEFYVFPEVLRSEIAKGFDPRRVVALLIERKWLKPGADGKSSAATSLPGYGKARCYHFSAAVLADE